MFHHDGIYCDVIINADLYKAGTLSVLLLSYILDICLFIFWLRCTFDLSCIFVDPLIYEYIGILKTNNSLFSDLIIHQ